MNNELLNTTCIHSDWHGREHDTNKYAESDADTFNEGCIFFMINAKSLKCTLKSMNQMSAKRYYTQYIHNDYNRTLKSRDHQFI